jgi:hypothetical protein
MSFDLLNKEITNTKFMWEEINRGENVTFVYKDDVTIKLIPAYMLYD